MQVKGCSNRNRCHFRGKGSQSAFKTTITTFLLFSLLYHRHHQSSSVVFPRSQEYCCLWSVMCLGTKCSRRVKTNFMGNTNCNIFWCLLCRRNFFFFNFQTESILAICTTRIQEMVSMPAYGLKKIQNLTIGFGIYLMRSRCVAAVFEGVRIGRKVRPPKGPHTWGIWGHASSKKF